MLEVYRSTSTTGLNQTLEAINFKTHECLLELKALYSKELEQLVANTFVRELQKESCAQQTTISASNQVPI
ncbi:unnamed protein product [Rhizophagus irregularis]|nr:unnamed protein product [Rhizophagus irregularis]